MVFALHLISWGFPRGSMTYFTFTFGGDSVTPQQSKADGSWRVFRGMSPMW